MGINLKKERENMETKYTPGPWEIRKSGFIMAPDGAGQGDDVYIAEILIGPDSPEVDEAKANARLIAAAPDLLEALVYLAEEVGRLMEWNDYIEDPDVEDAYENAFMVIAKAKGDK